MTDTEDRQYTAEMFSGEQISEALAALSDYDNYDDVATLRAGSYSPAVIKAFAALAVALDLDITAADYSGMKLRQLKPLDTRRETALTKLQYRAERGEIEPAYLYGKPDDDGTE